MKVVLITSAAPFIENKKHIQDMAFYSWALQKDLEVIVLGDDEGVTERCKIYDFLQISEIKTARDILGVNHGAIMLDDGLKRALPHIVDCDIVLWVNSDIVLIDNVVGELKRIGDTGFVGWGRRWDFSDWLFLLDMTLEQRFEAIKDKLNTGKIIVHPYCGIDSFFWSKEIFIKQVEILPAFVVNAWSTDHYFNRSQFELTKNRYEITNRIRGVHLAHRDVSLSSDVWHSCVEHNISLYNRATPKNVPMPLLLE